MAVLFRKKASLEQLNMLKKVKNFCMPDSFKINGNPYIA
jgi:hypothetical protein